MKSIDLVNNNLPILEVHQLPSEPHAMHADGPRAGGAWVTQHEIACTVKPVCNDHLFNKSYHLWSIR